MIVEAVSANRQFGDREFAGTVVLMTSGNRKSRNPKFYFRKSHRQVQRP
jgi:hypothetical protein